MPLRSDEMKLSEVACRRATKGTRANEEVSEEEPVRDPSTETKPYGHLNEIKNKVLDTQSSQRGQSHSSNNSKKKIKMAANARPSSPAGLNSSSNSTVDLQNIDVNKRVPHPQEWLLPHEWNIEKREMFENWKMDVQNQIANLADNLGTSLKKHPRNDIDEFDYSDTVENNELKKELMQRARMAGSTLHYGLARVQVPDKY